MTRVDGDTAVYVDGPRTARRHGIADVPRERRGEGMFEQLSIWENFGFPGCGTTRCPRGPRHGARPDGSPSTAARCA